ncbi:MAG: bifunctional phosphoserine phosphatase/homoserine phosphotransferase ThrH [Treponema sp.]|jgi:phosphoserine/homoserine phosphotransferase|nr:bifunctional phosphoserine phosphatase/homoserine phosphotransferase ThrH [Treponema sp.]
MNIVCLDLEGVLVPEIWIAFSEATGIPEFRRTTRDEPDYDKLMNYRLALLKKHNFRLADIQKVIAGMDVLEGALEFTQKIRKKTQLILLSDTYVEFASPLLEKLNWPTLFCNSLELGSQGEVTGYKLRQKEGKRETIKALKSLNMKVFAAGDSFNDLKMINEADAGCLFRAPERIRLDYSNIPCVNSFAELFGEISKFLGD